MDAYGLVSLAGSLVSLGMFAWLLVGSAHAYRLFHDDHAALDLFAALGLTVASLGLAVSALAAAIDTPTSSKAVLDITLEAKVVGLSMCRASMVLTAVVYVSARRAVRRARHSPEADLS